MTTATELRDRILDPDQREAALEEIVDSGASDCSELGVLALDDPRSDVRILALKVLNQSTSIEDLSRVLALLDDPDEVARVEALECVASHGSRGEAERVCALLGDPTPLVRAYAGWALAELDARSLEPSVRSRLDAEDSDLARAGLLEACVRLGGHRQADLERLAGILKSEDHQARAFAANSLVGSATDENREYVRGVLSEAVRSEQKQGIKGTLEKNLAELDASSD